MVNTHLTHLQVLLDHRKPKLKVPWEPSHLSEGPLVWKHQATCSGEDAGKETFSGAWVECQLVQPLGNPVRTLNQSYCIIQLCHSCNTRILNPPLRDTRTCRFMATLFHSNQDTEPPTYPSTNERLKEIWYTYTTEFCSATKRSEAVTLTGIWVSWRSLHEIRQTREDKYVFSHMRNLDLNVCTSTCLCVWGGVAVERAPGSRQWGLQGEGRGRRKRQQTVDWISSVCVMKTVWVREEGRRGRGERGRAVNKNCVMVQMHGMSWWNPLFCVSKNYFKN